MKVFAAKLDRRPQADSVRPRDGDDAFVSFAHPGDDRSVIKANCQLHFHWHFAALTDNLTQEIRSVSSGSHAIDQRYGAGFRFEGRFQDKGVFAIAAMDALDRAVGCYQPIAIF